MFNISPKEKNQNTKSNNDPVDRSVDQFPNRYMLKMSEIVEIIVNFP